MLVPRAKALGLQIVDVGPPSPSSRCAPGFGGATFACARFASVWRRLERATGIEPV